MTDTRILPGSGRTVQLQMPDLYSALAASAGGIPNPLLHPIIRLIDSLRPDNMTEALVKSRDNIIALYNLASLCLVEPKLILTGTPGEGEIGPGALRFDDVQWIYWSYFRSDTTTFIAQVRNAYLAGVFSGLLPSESGAPLPPESAIGDH